MKRSASQNAGLRSKSVARMSDHPLVPQKSEFGLQGYIIQKHSHLDKINSMKWQIDKSKMGKYTFLDDVMKEAKKKCDSKLYIKQSDWKGDAA